MRNSLFARLLFRARHRGDFRARAHTVWLRLLGAQIGKKTHLDRCRVTWPHQVRLGARCTIEHYVSFKYDGIYKKGPSIVIGDECFIGTGVEFNIREKITVGNHVLIASGCRFIDGNHGMERGDVPIGGQEGTSHPIVLEDDVWLGANVIILEGVSIGRGSIIGAGAVVTKSVPSYEVWGGVPARYIRSRTSSPTNSIDDPIR